MSYAGWPAEAVAIVEAGVARHGGWALWRRLRAVRLVPTALGGMLPWMKGVGRTFPLPAAVEIYPHETRTVLCEFPAAGQRGVFERGDVRLEGAGGAVLAASADHRRTFTWPRRYRRWSPMDALYFFGYALANYHAFPFLLPRASFAGWRRWRRRGRGALRGLTLDLPPDVPTHSRRQTFFFDDDGLLVRHDYVAEIVGAWARAAHLWQAHVDVDGLVVATRRRVLARLGTTALPVPALTATLERFVIEVADQTI
jgi:hypothetical protein